MPYMLTDFIAVPLPLAMPSDDLSTGAVDSTLDQSIGGVFDVVGSGRRYPGRHQFTHKGLYEGGQSETLTRVAGDASVTRLTKTGDTRVVINNPLANLQAMTDALKAQIGMRGPLYRQRLYDGARSWKTCRLLEVQHVETVEQAGVVSDVQSTYETAMNGWHEAAATVVSGNAGAGGLVALIIQNGGMLPIHDAVLTVACTSGTITQVLVSGPNIDITWTGSLSSGQTLTIDAGNQTVTEDGADAYAGFVLGPAVRHWLPLALSGGYILVTLTGGAGTVTMSYYNQWP